MDKDFMLNYYDKMVRPISTPWTSTAITAKRTIRWL